jgi:hypothetical protein
LRALVPIAVLALAASPGVASASPSFPTTALPLSATGADVADPQVAVTPQGGAYYAWVRFNGSVNVVQRRFCEAGDPCDSVSTLSAADENASSPALAALPDGTAVAVWQEFEPDDDLVIKAARLSPGVGNTAFGVLSDASNDSETPDVAANSSGRANFVWTDKGGTQDTIQMSSSVPATGAIVGPLTVVSEGSIDYSDPHVAMGANGDSVIAYRANDGIGDFEIGWNRRDVNGIFAGGTIGFDASATSNGIDRDEVDVAVNRTGEADAVITWREDVGATTQIKARRVEQDDSTPVGVLDVSDDSQNADQAQVGIGRIGKAFLTWRRNNGTNNIAQARTLSNSAVLSGATHNLSTGGANADQPRVAVDASNNASFAWRRGLNIQSRGLTPSEVLTNTQDITTAGSNTEPRIDVSPNGVRWGAYRLDNGTNDQAFGFFDLTPPALPDAGPPETTITSGPANGGSTSENPVTFGFSSEAGATFECSLGFGLLSSFGPCSGPAGSHTTPLLGLGGPFSFSVRAIDTNNNYDPTPALTTFTVVEASATPPGGTPAVTPPTTPQATTKKCRKGQKLKKGKCVKKRRKEK